jgi:hypothetical protein
MNMRRLLMLCAIAALVCLSACEAKTDEAPEKKSGEAAEGETKPKAEAAGEAEPGDSAKPPLYTGELRAETLPDLAFEVPVDWVAAPPANQMRVGEFKLPGDTDKASLVIFRFAGGAGTRQANIDRWLGQFQLEGGTAATEADATIESYEVNELAVTSLEVAGTYVASMRPGAPAAHNEANWAMFAAIVEGSGDAFYFKAVGPAAKIDEWRPGIERMLLSLSKP